MEIYAEINKMARWHYLYYNTAMIKQFLYAYAILVSATSALADQLPSLNLNKPCTNEQSVKAGYDLDYLVSRNGWVFRQFLFKKQPVFSEKETIFAVALKQKLQSMGSTLILLPIPNKSIISAQEIAYDAADLQNYFFGEINRLRNLQIDTVNLLSLANSNYRDKSNGTEFMVRTDYHWSSYGAKISADLIGDHIKSLPEFKQQKTYRFVTNSKVQLTLGNLGIELRDHCKIDVKPDITIKYTTKKAESEESLLEDPQDALLILGTSFSADQTFNFEGDLESATGLGTLNYSVSGGGKYGAMEAFFSKKENIAHLPTFIIWEFPNYSPPEDERAQKLLALINSWH